jgi:hypothetical protein
MSKRIEKLTIVTIGYEVVMVKRWKGITRESFEVKRAELKSSWGN